MNKKTHSTFHLHERLTVMAPFYMSLARLHGQHARYSILQSQTEFGTATTDIRSPHREKTPTTEHAPSPQQSLFFKLPAEIRNEVRAPSW